MKTKSYIITRTDTNATVMVKEASKDMAMTKYESKHYKDWRGPSFAKDGLWHIYNDFGMEISFTISET